MYKNVLVVLLIVISGLVVMPSHSIVSGDTAVSATDSAATSSATDSAKPTPTSDTTTTTTTTDTTANVDIELPTGFFDNFSDLINDVLRLVIVLAALLTFVYLIWGAFEWITSGGDKGKTDAARGKIVSAILGLIIVASSYAVLIVLLNFLGYENLEDIINNLPGM